MPSVRLRTPLSRALSKDFKRFDVGSLDKELQFLEEEANKAKLVSDVRVGYMTGHAQRQTSITRAGARPPVSSPCKCSPITDLGFAAAQAAERARKEAWAKAESETRAAEDRLRADSDVRSAVARAQADAILKAETAVKEVAKSESR